MNKQVNSWAAVDFNIFNDDDQRHKKKNVSSGNAKQWIGDSPDKGMDGASGIHGFMTHV